MAPRKRASDEQQQRPATRGQALKHARSAAEASRFAKRTNGEVQLRRQACLCCCRVQQAGALEELSPLLQRRLVSNLHGLSDVQALLQTCQAVRRAVSSASEEVHTLVKVRLVHLCAAQCKQVTYALHTGEAATWPPTLHGPARHRPAASRQRSTLRCSLATSAARQQDPADCHPGDAEG